MAFDDDVKYFQANEKALMEECPNMFILIKEGRGSWSFFGFSRRS
ncbi:MAG: hypothetical protein QXU18_09970 [Thermoplasmatales archaeon]